MARIASTSRCSGTAGSRNTGGEGEEANGNTGSDRFPQKDKHIESKGSVSWVLAQRIFFRIIMCILSRSAFR